jgi:hypothetical protein
MIVIGCQCQWIWDIQSLKIHQQLTAVF